MDACWAYWLHSCGASGTLRATQRTRRVHREGEEQPVHVHGRYCFGAMKPPVFAWAQQLAATGFILVSYRRHNGFIPLGTASWTPAPRVDASACTSSPGHWMGSATCRGWSPVGFIPVSYRFHTHWHRQRSCWMPAPRVDAGACTSSLGHYGCAQQLAAACFILV